MKVVRDSKYRHVFGDPLKTKYEDLRLSSKANESCSIAASATHFAFPWESGGGGALAVIPHDRFGRQKRDMPLITGHSGPILDFEFDPFDENMILSASEDQTVKLWQIPEGGMKEHLKEPLVSLEGHGKKVSFCTFNPTAACIAASASFDQTIRVWNISEQDQAFKLETPEQVWSLKWNYCGSLLAATAKDKNLHLIDPRQSKIAASQKICDGSKASKVVWVGHGTETEECNKLITTSFSAQAERQVALWDTRMLNSDGTGEALTEFVMDQGTGAIYPFFDPGTQMLFLAGKGDANVRFFELTKEDPYLHFITQHADKTPQKGYCFIPKANVDVSKHEIMRGMKLETTAVVPTSFKVPRKSEAFQEDIFPDCYAGVAAMNPEQWVTGCEARMPVLKSMAPGADGPKKAAAKSAGGVVSVKELKSQLAEANARIQALEKENEELKKKLAEAESKAA